MKWSSMVTELVTALLAAMFGLFTLLPLQSNEAKAAIAFSGAAILAVLLFARRQKKAER